jgi:hypothetical protein
VAAGVETEALRRGPPGFLHDGVPADDAVVWRQGWFGFQSCLSVESAVANAFGLVLCSLPCAFSGRPTHDGGSVEHLAADLVRPPPVSIIDGDEAGLGQLVKPPMDRAPVETEFTAELPWTHAYASPLKALNDPQAILPEATPPKGIEIEQPPTVATLTHPPCRDFDPHYKSQVWPGRIRGSE